MKDVLLYFFYFFIDVDDRLNCYGESIKNLYEMKKKQEKSRYNLMIGRKVFFRIHTHSTVFDYDAELDTLLIDFQSSNTEDLARKI